MSVGRVSHDHPLYSMRALERIASRSHEDERGCWIFAGALWRGYGQVGISTPSGACTAKVHRVAYETLVAPIPAQQQIDHLCRNRACWNPDHLEAVPQRVNILRGTSPSAHHAVKTHCPYGHAYAEHGTRRANGQRYCRECDKRYRPAKNAARRERRRAMGGRPGGAR